MIQRVGFVSTMLTALVAAACGRQVTPNPPGLGPGGAPPGYLAIHYDVVSPFNFSNYQYMIVFNTTGSGVTPSTQTVQTNWAGYSFGLIALGNGIDTYAEAIQFIHSTQNPHSPPAWQNVHPTPQQFSFNPNSNGAGTEFSMLAQKVIFKGIVSPSPSASPSNLWKFNAFVTEASNGGQWQFYDSMGAGGRNPPEFVSPTLNMDTCFDSTYYAQDNTISAPSAQILSVEISNNPSAPNSC
jgi:hypothetical protein